jgi:hypothetical protein
MLDDAKYVSEEQDKHNSKRKHGRDENGPFTGLTGRARRVDPDPKILISRVRVQKNLINRVRVPGPKKMDPTGSTRAAQVCQGR